MRKIFIFLLFCVIVTGCNSKSEAERWTEQMNLKYVPITENDLCGQWADDSGLTYEFRENVHKRYKNNELFFNGTYLLKDNSVLITEPNEKKSKLIIVVKDSENYRFLSDSGIGALFEVDLIHKEKC